ncbi:HMG box transcription factor BBX-like [Gigantopelta aegis]|uniref:HMG box transcription factor BBX-like n=1 Tax=Gigantopelta aegis TaxID=1735272 RepID=UPI001B88D736|nr:HMG box transcription factor BBX-like [Gigantopelta aegis]
MDSPESDKKDVRRPMNAFLIFCKRHRAIVREKHPDLDNRSVTKILGDLWANLGEDDKSVYTKLAKQYKDAFMKANPDYKWYNPEKVLQPPTKMTTRPTNIRVLNGAPEISLDGKIVPGKLADPSNMGGLNLLLMAGQQSMSSRSSSCGSPEKEKRVTPPDQLSPKSALLELAEMCANELQLDDDDNSQVTTTDTKSKAGKCRAIRQPDGCCTTPQDGGPSIYADVLNDEEVVTKKPKSKPTRWKIKKTVEISPPTHTDIDKSYTDGGTQSSTNVCSSKKICRMSDAHVSVEHGTPKGNVEEEEHQHKCLKTAVNKTEEMTFGGELLQGGDNSGDGDQKVEVKRFRRMSNAETLAECLSDQSDDPVTITNKVDGSTFSTDGTGDVKVTVKVKQKAGATETSLSTEKAAKMMLVKENRAPLLPCITVPQYPKSERRSQITGKVVSEAAGKISEAAGKVCEKKRSLSPDSENCHLKEEKSELDVNTGNEDDQDLQPVRKSRRRNRGQRYQELIDEGIIQPSKERLAARRAEKTFTGSSSGESFLVCDETFFDDEVIEMKHPPKRSASETEITDERKYKTGDFDLEAHIAVLPACSLEQCPKGRKIAKVRHNSEGSPRKPLSNNDNVSSQTLILPPHVKVKSPSQLGEPVTGSRKRKARKHSITHLLLTACDTDQNTSGDSVKQESENIKETMLSMTTELPETDENVRNVDSTKLDLKTAIKLEQLETEVCFLPKVNEKCIKSEKEQIVQEKSTNILDDQAFSGIDEKESKPVCFPNRDEKEEDRDVFEKDEREGNSGDDETGNRSVDPVVKDVAVTTETKLILNVDKSCEPVVLSKTGIKSDTDHALVCICADGDVVGDDENSVVLTSRDVCRDKTATQQLTATASENYNIEKLTEKSRPLLNDGTEMKSVVPGEKITRLSKDEASDHGDDDDDDDDCLEKKPNKNLSVEFAPSSDGFKRTADGLNTVMHVSSPAENHPADQSVVIATDKQEEKPSLDNESVSISESPSFSVTMVTEKQEEENCSEAEPYSAVSTTEADKQQISSTDAVHLSPGTTIMDVSTANANTVLIGELHSIKNPTTLDARVTSPAGTVATDIVTMVTDPAVTVATDIATMVTDPVVTVVTEVATMVTYPAVTTVTEVATMVTNPAVTTVTEVATMVTNPVFAAVSDDTTGSSIATMTPYSATTTPSTNQVVMVSTPAACTVVSSVSMVSSPASTVINPVAMVSSPVTAVASPVSAVSSPVTAVCS